MSARIRFRACEGAEGEPASALAEVQRKLGVQFPEELSQLFLAAAECHVDLLGYCGKFGVDICSLSAPRYEYVSRLLLVEWQSEFTSYPLVIPFAGCGGGDLLCLDYRRNSDPVVVAWRLEVAYSRPEPFHLVARHFSEFCERSDSAQWSRFREEDARIAEAEIVALLGENCLRPLRWSVP